MLAWDISPATASADGEFDESDFEEDDELAGGQDFSGVDEEDDEFDDERYDEYEEYEEYEEFADDEDRHHSHPRRADWDG